MSISTKIIQAAAGVGGAVAPTDPNFSDTTLLLQADDVNDGSQNNTFLDSSTNNHTITRNGNVTQGSFSPFSQDEGKWGNQFDGADGAFLQLPNDTSTDLSTGDFTIECWVNYSSFINDAKIYIDVTNGSNYAQLTFSTSLGLRFIVNASTVANQGNVNGWETGVWYHVALVRNGSNFTIYRDGVSIASGTRSASIGNFNAKCIGGSNGFPATTMNGYISNFRMVKGTALYTSAFTPPTAPLTAISGTSALTCQSNRFVDNSSNAHAITVNGDPEVTPFSPFAPSTAYDPATKGGSGYFDGSGDDLQLADSDDWHIGGGDFTIDGWIYKGNKGSGSNLIAQRQTSTAEIRILLDSDGSGYNEGYFRLEWGAGSLVWNAGIQSNSWTHFALVRSGTTGTLYINGTSVGTNTLNNVSNFSGSLYIGALSGSAEFYLGYISNLRLVKGTAIAPSGIPTAPASAVSGTELLLNFTNASIYDGTGRNVLETVGDAQVDTAVKKYGTGSMQFDGTGDRLVSPPSEQFNFGSGDFTVEAWFYATSIDAGGTHHIVSYATNTTNFWAIRFRNSDNSGLQFRLFETSEIVNISQGSDFTTTDQWFHVAVTRNGNSWRMFLDGTQVGSTVTNSSAISDYTGSLQVGDIASIGETFTGYIDDLRITKGVARYTANFTPPAAKLPNL